MKTFTVYKHPVNGYEAVKQGFSWPALLLGWIWMLVCKLWLLASIWISIAIAISSIEFVADRSDNDNALILYASIILVQIILCLIAGFSGNEWRATNLVKRGYSVLGSTQTSTKDAALAQYAQVP